MTQDFLYTSDNINKTLTAVSIQVFLLILVISFWVPPTVRFQFNSIVNSMLFRILLVCKWWQTHAGCVGVVAFILSSFIFRNKLWNTKTIKENQTKTDEVEYVNADSNTIYKKNDILFQWQHTNYTNLQNSGGGCGGGVDYLFRGWWRCRRCQSSNTHTSINANAFPTNVGKMDTQRLEKSIDSRHPQLITNYTEHSHCWHSCRTTIEANMRGEKKNHFHKSANMKTKQVLLHK